MTLLNDLLPIIEKKGKSSNSRPITAKDRESIRNLLNEEARLERLASQSINKDSNASRYLLEPIPHELFDIYQYEEDMTVQQASNDSLSLLPVGKLNLFDDSDSETVDLNNNSRDNEDQQPAPLAFDMPAYQARRRKLFEKQNTIEISEEASPVPTTPGLSVDTPMMARSSLAIQQQQQPAVAPFVPSPQLQQPQPQQQVPVAEEYQPNTQEVNDMVNQVLNSVDDDMLMAEADNELEGTIRAALAAPQAPTASTAPASTAPASTAPASTAPQSTAPVSRVIEEPATNAHRWYNDDELITTDSAVAAEIDPSSRKNIYSFLKQVIPIFATKNQQSECNKITVEANTRNTSTSTDFKKSVDALNFPNANLDLTLEDHWNTSGKTVFIKRLLTSLSNEDKIIVFATDNLNDEANLMEMLTKSLNLTCLRVGALLDENWDGEYGVILKTQDKSDTKTTSTQKQQQFTPHADLIICLDVRISSNHNLFSKISKRGATTTDIIPPRAWLIAVGSVEDRVFSFLKANHLPLSDETIKSIQFKTLVKADNKWPEINLEDFNVAIADNVKSWFLSASVNMTNYQYRSTLILPNASHLAYIILPPKTTATTTTAAAGLIQDETVVDTDTTEENVAPSPAVLSDELKAYINDYFIRPFDISRGQLKSYSNEQQLLSLPDADKKIMEPLHSTVYKDYCNQVNTLKRQYEVAFQELESKYRQKAYEAATAALKK